MATIRTIDTTSEDIALFNARKNCKSIKDSMKIYENRPIHEAIPENRPFIVRLNGNSFTKMNIYVNSDTTIQEINKSYNLAIINTARCLLNDIMFKPRMVYVVDDEIVLLFHKADIFKRSVQKYLTLLSSKATNYFRNCFADYMPRSKIQKYSNETVTSMKTNMPVFEGRIVYFPADKTYELVNYFIWRANQRNPIQEYTRTIVGKSNIQHKPNSKLAEIVEDYANDNIDKVLPDYTKYGVFMKRTLYSACYITSDSCDGKTDDSNVTYPIDCIWSMKFKYGNDVLDEMLAKYYNQDKWNIISKKPTTTLWKSYCLDTFDHDSHPEGEITESEDEEYSAHLEKQQTLRNGFKFKQTDEQFNNIYMCIPGMTLVLMFIHCFQILTHVPLKRQLYDLTTFGFLYNSLISMVSNKSYPSVKISQYVWALLMVCVNIPSLFNFMTSSHNIKLVSVIGIVYGIYITMFVGIYMFYRATSTMTRTKTNHIIIYQKINNDSVYDSDSSTSSASLHQLFNHSDSETSEDDQSTTTTTTTTTTTEQSENLGSSSTSSKKDD